MKLTLIGICAFALLLNTGCSTTKTATNTSTKSAIASNGKDEKLPPVAEAPSRGAWGRNISPYSY
jgi:hypothetical protein